MLIFHKKIYWIKTGFLLYILLCSIFAFAQPTKPDYKLVKTITGKLSPKSISNNGRNLFFAQNMMYNHTVTVYDSAFNLVSTIDDNVKPAEFGFKKIEGTVNGAPVESVATKDGKYMWVSNYNMSGSGFSNPGCDTCYGSSYDESFVYKINTRNYKIENIVKVGSVPKFLNITPDQKKLIVSNWSGGNVSIVDLETEKEVKRVYVGPAPRGIACDTASMYAYVAVMGCNKIVKIDLNTYETTTIASCIRNPRHLCIAKNYLYASLNGEQSVCRINLLDMSMKKIVIGKAPRSMVLSSVKNKLFVDCYEDAQIAIVDLADFKVEGILKTNTYPIGICLSNDSKQIWVSCYTGSIQVFAEENGEKAESLAIAPEKKKSDVGILPPLNIIATQSYAPKMDSVVVVQKPAESKEKGQSYIVLGSFSVKENALMLKSKLVKKGIDVEIVNNIEKGYVYCACKAKGDKEESEKLKSHIESLTGIKGWLYQLPISDIRG